MNKPIIDEQEARFTGRFKTEKTHRNDNKDYYFIIRCANNGVGDKPNGEGTWNTLDILKVDLVVEIPENEGVELIKVLNHQNEEKPS